MIVPGPEGCRQCLSHSSGNADGVKNLPGADSDRPPDPSNGYEEIAPSYIAHREQNAAAIGASIVANWSTHLRPRATILDLGCGTGIPITKTLLERGFTVYGIDASPTMVAAFRTNFPAVPVQNAAAEDSDFFCRPFDGIVAWGLFFLLKPNVQRNLIAKIAAALSPGGRLLFTAPRQICTWTDTMTQRPSVSLGHAAYQNALEAEGLSLIGTQLDSHDNHYYFARKT